MFTIENNNAPNKILLIVSKRMLLYIYQKRMLIFITGISLNKFSNQNEVNPKVRKDQVSFTIAMENWNSQTSELATILAHSNCRNEIRPINRGRN